MSSPARDPVRGLLRRRPPPSALRWAAAAVGAGGRVVRVRPLASGWLANHAVDVADAVGVVHRLVLRRWARPGWEVDDPTLTAAREAAVLELLAATPVPAPRWPPARPRRASGASSTATTTRATPFLVHQRLSALTDGTGRSCATWASTRVRSPLPVSCSWVGLPGRVAGGSCPARTRSPTLPGR
jgi:hypothetical protein